MNEVNTYMTVLRELVVASQETESVVEKASLFSATRLLLDGACKNHLPGSYVREKANNVSVHIAASLHFDHDFGLSLNGHKKAALIELSSLESALMHAR